MAQRAVLPMMMMNYRIHVKGKVVPVLNSLSTMP
jgi:hypothetical protein